jgi:hypothetical protein
MTIPAKRWLVLRRSAAKRPPQPSDQQKWGRFGVESQEFSPRSHFGFEIRQEFGMMSGLGGGKWEIL